MSIGAPDLPPEASRSNAAELRQSLRARCSPSAADEHLVVDLVVESATVLWAVNDVQVRLARALSPDILADARRTQVVLTALKTAADIGNALAKRIESGIQCAAVLKAARAAGLRQ